MTVTALQVQSCLDCGKCTSSCPVARHDRTLSPRRLIGRLAAGRPPGAAEALWTCLTCMQCDAGCPRQIPISQAVPGLRREARERGETPAATRCSALEAVAALQSQADLPQQRLDWLDGDLEVDPRGKVMVWTGCTPYFDVFFAEGGVQTLAAVKGVIRLLNALGIAPAVRGDERCCGHDALWSGDEATFARLAERNLRMFEDAAPELVVTVCPECQLTLIDEYRRRFGQPACRVIHASELIAEHREDLPLAARDLAVTFADPCRLGRHQGRYEEPRAALAAVPGLALHEMPRRRQGAACCGGNWLACGQAAKRIQTDLLRAAADTGAELLVTACPKCLIHLKCAQNGEDAAVPDIGIVDLAAVVAGALDEDRLRPAGRSKSTKGG